MQVTICAGESVDHCRPSRLQTVGASGSRTLVPRVVHIAGYNLFSLTRASAVVKCQSALACFLLRLFSHAATSSVRVCLSEMRRSRHWLDKMLSSDSAMSSQLPCLGV